MSPPINNNWTYPLSIVLEENPHPNMGDEKNPSKPVFHTIVRPVIVKSLCSISTMIKENRY